jgi:hypothetical protein
VWEPTTKSLLKTRELLILLKAQTIKTAPTAAPSAI